MFLSNGVLCATNSSGPGFVYTNFWDLGVRGRAFESTNDLNRLPNDAENVVGKKTWSVAQNTAGMYIDFESNSPSISVIYELLRPELESDNFPSSGASGMDLYAYDEGNTTWRWVGTTRTIAFPQATNLMAMGMPSDRKFTYRLHLPVFNGVINMSIGVLESYELNPSSTKTKKSIVWYGTAAVQGGVASRPGQSFINILRRELEDTEIYNFGFSDHNQPMDVNVVKFLSRIPADMFVIDCLSDMDENSVVEQAEPVIKLIRNDHPETPIILAEGPLLGNAWIMPQSNRVQQGRRNALRYIYNRLMKAGDKHLIYAQGCMMYNTSRDFVSPTVLGKLPTDLGMYEISDYYKVIIPHSINPNRSIPLKTDNCRHSPLTENSKKVSAHDGQTHITSGYLQADSILFKNFQELGVRGRAFNDTVNYFNRLPAAAQVHVRKRVWKLSLMTTGMFVHFASNATSLYINYTTTTRINSLWHMPMTGTSGADLFAYDAGNSTWRFVAAVGDQLKKSSTSVSGWLATGLQPSDKMRIFRLFLPLRNSIVAGWIGVLPGSYLGPDPDYNPPPPVVWYGTSIVQGGAVSRPGSTFTNILTRNLGREVYNFGFAGNGKMEINVAQYLVTIQPQALFVIDCNPNLNGHSVAKLIEPLVRYIRQHQPTVPIVLAEGTEYGDDWLGTGQYIGQEAKRQALRKGYENLVSSGVKGLHYVRGIDLFAARPFVNPTVGGTHPSDLGHREIAEFYTNYLPTILEH